MKKLILILMLLVFTGICVIADDLVIESKTQSYSEADNKIKFEGDVHVNIGDVHVVGDAADVTLTPKNKLNVATFYDKPYAYETKQNKKREVKANILKVSLLNKVIRAEGDTLLTVTDGKTPVAVITADAQEYDTNKNIMTATGKVVIKYEDIETFSDKAIMQTDKNGNIKKMDLIGNAKLEEKGNHAEANHFTYNAVTDELTASGNVNSVAIMDNGEKLTLKSDYQHFNKKTNTFMGSGHVRVWYMDYYGQGPKISFYPDKKSNKPNEIYFVGRSSVSQNEKVIYADKIQMILSPKSFTAEGNVRSIIHNVGNAGEL